MRYAEIHQQRPFLPAQLEKGRILLKNLGLGSKSFKRVENEVRLTLIKVSSIVPSHSSRKSFSLGRRESSKGWSWFGKCLDRFV
jgi:hypothetical protein